MLAGASAINMEKVQVHPMGLGNPKERDPKVKFFAVEALCGVGGLLLYNTGTWFVDEVEQRDHVTEKMWENSKYPIRLILNGAASEEIEWHRNHHVGSGLMKRFKSSAALAKDMGLTRRCSPRRAASITTVSGLRRIRLARSSLQKANGR